MNKLLLLFLFLITLPIYSEAIDANSPDEVYAFLDNLAVLIKNAKSDEVVIESILKEQSLKFDNISFLYVAFEDKRTILFPSYNFPKGYDPTKFPWYKTLDTYFGKYSVPGDSEYATYSKAFYDEFNVKIGVVAIDLKI